MLPLSSLLLAATALLGAAGVDPPPDGCAPAELTVVGVTGGALDPPSCPTQTAGTLALEPGGHVVLEDRDGARQTCVRVAEGLGRYRLGAGGAPLQAEAGSCQSREGHWSCRDEGAPSLVCTRPRTRAASSATADRLALFVLDFDARGPTESVTRVVADLVTGRLAERRQLDVFSGADVQDLLKLEAERQATGCSEGSCLAELAGALGARYVVTGSVTDAEGLVRVDLSLLDTADARVVGRQRAEGRTLEELGTRLDATVHNLLVEVLELEPRAVPPLPTGRSMGSGDAIGGAALAGGTAAAATALVAGGPLAAVGTVALFLGGLDLLVLVAVAAPACGLCFPCGAAGLASAMADLAFGYPVQPWRALATALATQASFLVLGALGTAASLVGVIWVSDNLGVIPGDDTSILIAFLLAAAGALALSGVAAGAVAAATYEVSIGLFGDALPSDDAGPEAAELAALPPTSRPRAQAF